MQIWKKLHKGQGYAQPLWLSGCLKKGNFTAKNAYLMVSNKFLIVRINLLHSVGR